MSYDYTVTYYDRNDDLVEEAFQTEEKARQEAIKKIKEGEATEVQVSKAITTYKIEAVEVK